MELMKCVRCGQEYNNEKNECPACGSNIVDKRATDMAQISVSEHAMRGGWRDGKLAGFMESEGTNQSSAAEADEDGTVYSWISGNPVQGENDTVSVARVLVEVMNKNSDQWELADESPVGAVDCFLQHRLDPARQLEVQVVRAIVDAKLYRKLAIAKSVVEVHLDPKDIAERLFNAVTKKANHYPVQLRRGLLLALDAMRVSVCTMSSVIEAYRCNFGQRTRNLGFMEVWLVGPADSMTQRLDGQDHEAA
jgi:DNA-directed RNA polymerase subunit RPC12/RpoP